MMMGHYLHHPQKDQPHELRDFRTGVPQLAEGRQRGADDQDAGDDVCGRGVETEFVQIDACPRLFGIP